MVEEERSRESEAERINLDLRTPTVFSLLYISQHNPSFFLHLPVSYTLFYTPSSRPLLTSPSSPRSSMLPLGPSSPALFGL